jgi:hypothetical protein
MREEVTVTARAGWSDPAEAGRKGAAARWRRDRLKKEDPERYMRELFDASKADLSQALLDAALGRNEWHDLPLDKRLAAITKALEYSVGRPASQKVAPSDGGTSESVDQGGLEME